MLCVAFYRRRVAGSRVGAGTLVVPLSVWYGRMPSVFSMAALTPLAIRAPPEVCQV